MRNRPGRTATRRTTQATEVTTSRPHLVHALYFSAARAFHVRDGHSLSLSRLFFGAATPALHALTASSRYSSQTKDARRETKGKKREESHEALKGTRQCRWWTETPPQPAGRAPRRKRGTGRADAVEQPHRQTDTRSGAGEKDNGPRESHKKRRRTRGTQSSSPRCCHRSECRTRQRRGHHRPANAWRPLSRARRSTPGD